MNLRYCLFFILFFCFQSGFAQDTVFLDGPNSRPHLQVYRPAEKKTKIAMIVCSGGSYGGTADPVEGTPASKLLAENGITAFLLDYRVPAAMARGKDSVPFADVELALKYVKANAKKYGINVAKIGIMGFSAGGHLVSTIGTHLKENRPAFMVLVYPVISMQENLTHAGSRQNLLGSNPSQHAIDYFSNELQVSEHTTPAFIVSSLDDQVVKVENSLLFSAALREKGVKTDLFLCKKGYHGFGVDNQQSMGIQWTVPMLDWVKKEKWK